jgi:aspartate aminotransferase-like enzyme
MSLKKVGAGFSLVETLVYLSIFIVVSTASVYVLFSLNEIIDNYRVTTSLYRSGANVMEQIVTSIREADQLSGATVLHASSTGVLAVMNGTQTTQFTKAGDDLLFSKAGASFGSLLAPNVDVIGFTVFQYPTTVGTLVRVKLDLEATSGSTTRAVSLYGGSIIRGDL